jgi:hypothetical protein
VDLHGEVARVQGEVLEGEQEGGRAEWEARGPAPAQAESVCVPVAEPLLPIRRDYPATSAVVPSAGRKWSGSRVSRYMLSSCVMVWGSVDYHGKGS